MTKFRISRTILTMSSNKDEYFIKFESDYEPNARGLGYELFTAMKQYRHKTAQIEGETGITESYDFLLKRAIRLALRLKEENLQKTDIISVCSNNHLNVCLPYIATSFLNVRFSPLDPIFSVNDFKYFINLIRPKIIFIIPQVQEKIQLALKEIQCDTQLILFDENFEKYLEKHEDEDQFKPAIPDSIKETWDIHFSSGSTGMPKGICLSQYTVMCQAVNVIKSGQIGRKLSLSNYAIEVSDADTVLLTYSALYWMTATILVVSCILTGSTRIIYNKYDVDKFWEALHKYKVSHIFLSTTMMSALAQKDAVYKGDALKTLISGGAKIPIHHLKHMLKLFPNLIIRQAYGLTEVGSYLTSSYLDKNSVNLTSCGHSVGSFMFKVVDLETNQILPFTEPGELRIKTPYIFNGYYKSDCSSDFDEDGWFKTGDIVRFDGEKNLYFVRRCKDLLKYRSYHLPTLFIEETVLQHPAVKQAVIVGLRNEKDGEHATAVVTLESEIKPDEIRRFVNERVNEISKLRGGVRVVDDFPLTAAGKINRPLVKEMLNSGQL